MKRFRNILYVAESSGVILKAFHHAVALAERNNARLTVVIALERMPPYLMRLAPPRLEQLRIEECQTALDRMCEWVSHRAQVEAKILEGRPFLEVIREVVRNGRDLVVKSAEGDSSPQSRPFGTTDLHLLRKCPCPVWLIRSTDPSPIHRVMGCVNFDEFDPPDQDTAEPLNRLILELAGSVAFQERGELHIAHAWEAIGENAMRGSRGGVDAEVDAYIREVRLRHQRWLDRLLREARTWIGPATYDSLQPQTHLPKGSANDAIPALARELKIDLIVMGTVARTGIPGLFIGNTAETILSKIECSVLAVKPKGFVTPVTCES